MGNVKIISVFTGKYLASDTKENNSLIYATGNPSSALVFNQKADGSFELIYDKNTKLYLSFRSNTGAVKLFDSSDEAKYDVNPVKTFIPNLNAVSILNRAFQQYMWVDKTEPFVAAGHNQDARAWWVFEPA